jgi:hypothetical protein
MERKLLFIFITSRNVAPFYESGFSPNYEENKIFQKYENLSRMLYIVQVVINLEFRVFLNFL